MKYRREIDGLRALAVLPVILFHAGFDTFRGGFVGVDVFFVISGYLITSIIIYEKRAGIFSLKKFYERRARRILPVLYLMIAVCIAIAWVWLLPNDMLDFSKSIASVSVFGSNIYFWKNSNYFDGAAEFKPLLHTWSLAVEEQYYLLFPIFLVITWKFGKKWVISLLFLVSVISLAMAHWLSFNQPITAFYLLPTRGWELLVGVFAAFFLVEKSDLIIPNSVKNILSIIGLVFILYAVFFYDKSIPFPSLYTLVPTFGTALIILCASPINYVGKVLSNKVLVGLGLISYSAYLWHQPLFAFARHRSFADINLISSLFLSVASFVIAYFSWRFVEQPFRRRNGFSGAKIFFAATFGMIIFLIFALVSYLSNGFTGRYDIKDKYLAELTSIVGPYVGARFNQLNHRSFDLGDDRKKILIIGDSFGMDFVNALFEVGLQNQIQISTHHISADCGNLYLYQSFENLISDEDRAKCSTYAFNGHWYENYSVKKLLSEADIVILASAWRNWQAELLSKSVSNIEHDFNAKVIVVGTKNFGVVNIKSLLEKDHFQRISIINEINKEQIKVNNHLRSTFRLEKFIDSSELLCGSGDFCKLFTDNGMLISYDGGHLTPDGAKYFGTKLLENPLIKDLITKDK